MSKSPIDVERIALVRPGSSLARQWKLAKPTYGIYDYNSAFDTHELRFGDGSWHSLDAAEIKDLVILEAQGPELVGALFD